MFLETICSSSPSLSQGVAVGVGEIDEQTLEALAETRRELEKTKAELAAVREENSDLQGRLNQFA
jgi:voltage-gated hydrogen channel 1